MLTKSFRVEVRGEIEQVWNKLRNIEELATCIPGCQDVKVVNDKTVQATIVQKIGVIPVVLSVENKIVEESPPYYLLCTGEGEHVKLSIRVFLSKEATSTKIDISLDLESFGPLKNVINQLFLKMSEKYIRDFQECLAAKFNVI